MHTRTHTLTSLELWSLLFGQNKYLMVAAESDCGLSSSIFYLFFRERKNIFWSDRRCTYATYATIWFGFLFAQTTAASVICANAPFILRVRCLHLFALSFAFFRFLCRCCCCKQDRFWRLSVRCNNDDNIICMLACYTCWDLRVFFLASSLRLWMPHQIFSLRLVIVRLIVVHIRFTSAFTTDSLCAIDMCTRCTSVQNFNTIQSRERCVCVCLCASANIEISFPLNTHAHAHAQ